MSEDGIILNTDLQLEEMAGQPTTLVPGVQISLTPATTAVTSQMQTVTTSTSQQRLMMGMGSSPFLNPAGPTQTQVAYQQVDLGQYIDQQVQSKISDYWQQQSNMAALMQMPQTRPQFPPFYPSGPMAMMGGMSGNSMYPSASGMGLPTNASATQSGVLKQKRKRSKRTEGRSEDPSGNRSAKGRATAASLFTAVPAGPAPKSRQDDDVISLYASGEDFSHSESSGEEESDRQTYSQDSDECSGDDDPPGPQLVDLTAKVKESVTDSAVSAPGMKPELQAALTAAIPAVLTSDSILPDLAETIKNTWQKPLDQKRVDEILAKIHPPDNAVFLRVQKTNDRVNNMLKKPSVAQDASICKTQQLTTSAAAQTAQLLHKLNGLPVGTKVDDDLLKDLMIALAEIFT